MTTLATRLRAALVANVHALERQHARICGRGFALSTLCAEVAEFRETGALMVAEDGFKFDGVPVLISEIIAADRLMIVVGSTVRAVVMLEEGKS